VLLTENGRPSHAEIRVTALQAALLFCPDDPRNPELRLSLETQQDLRLRPEGASGIRVISGAEEYLWPVSRIDLIAADSGLPGSPTEGLPDRALFEAADGEAVFAIGAQRYRGNLEIVLADPDRLHAVNALPMEAYVAGMLQAEMSTSWPDPALEAQAVAGRSYAYAHKLRGHSEADGLLRYDLTDGGRDPTYRGTGRGGRKIGWAVEDTRGLVLTAFGVPFTAHFHASSGGHSASVEDIDPGARTVDGKLPLADIMPAQEDPWCRPGAEKLGKLDSHWRREAVILKKAIRAPLKQQHGYEDAWIRDLDVSRHPSGRVDELRLTINVNPAKVVRMSGHEFRQLVGPERLRSTLWSDDSPRLVHGERENDIGYRIVSYGWGHGVGMSQVSAYAMADAGYSAIDILDFFYIGAQVDKKW